MVSAFVGGTATTVEDRMQGTLPFGYGRGLGCAKALANGFGRRFLLRVQHLYGGRMLAEIERQKGTLNPTDFES